jgi:hypothetical protein
MGCPAVMFGVAWVGRVALFSILTLNDSQFIRLPAAKCPAAVLFLVEPIHPRLALASGHSLLAIILYCLRVFHKNSPSGLRFQGCDSPLYFDYRASAAASQRPVVDGEKIQVNTLFPSRGSKLQFFGDSESRNSRGDFMTAACSLATAIFEPDLRNWINEFTINPVRGMRMN